MAVTSDGKAPQAGQSSTAETPGGEVPEVGLWDTAKPWGRVVHRAEAFERGQCSIVEARSGGIPEVGQKTGRELHKRVAVAWQHRMMAAEGPHSKGIKPRTPR